MNASLVSVVVPAFNAQTTIRQTIQAILNQTYNNVQIIIVDDGSTDNTASIVKSFQKVNYLYQDNAGPAAARNRGAGAASSEIIFFTDADCAPHPDWIEKILSGFNEPAIGVVCGSYGIANPQSLLARCIHKEILFRHEKLMPDYPKVFGSYNFAVRKKLFDEVGGFNTAYRNASGEDNDLSYQFIKAGYKIFFNKTALVDHVHTTHLIKYLKEQYRHGYWRVKMYQDHPAMMRGDDYTFWKDIVEIPLVFLTSISFVFLFLFPVWFNIFIGVSIVFFSIELFYGLLITKTFYEGVYSSLLMLMRAFSRAFGLSSGFMQFIDKRK